MRMRAVADGPRDSRRLTDQSGAVWLRPYLVTKEHR